MNAVRNKNNARIVLIASLLAFWPVVQWYAMRMLDGSDENFGLLALLTVAGLVLFQPAGNRQLGIPLSVISLLMGIYIISLFFLPPIMRAAIAMTVLGVLLSRRYSGQGLHPGLWGLLLLSLPVMASVQFYLGYPLRWIVGYLASHLLQLNGLTVTHSGTLLNWIGGSVSIDAPCSGAKMMWFGFYLCSTLTCLYRLSMIRLIALHSLTLMIIVVANTLRASTLFYIESNLIAMPGWAHDAVGVVTYIAAAIAILLLGNRLSSRFTLCTA